MNRPRLCFFVTEDWYFVSHRLPLALAARRAGYEVAVVTRVGEQGQVIRDAGLTLIPLRLGRRRVHPLRDPLAIMQVARIYRQRQFEIVHHVGMKPILYGVMAARLAGVPYVVNAFAGMGYLFTGRAPGVRARRMLVRRLLRGGLRGVAQRVIVQNPDDRGLVMREFGVASEAIVVIRGSGVDVDRFVVTAPPLGPPWVVVLPGRLLRDKGVEEFVAAARILRAEGFAARFALVGARDPENPSSVSEKALRGWLRDSVVEHWGHRNDMERVLSAAHIVCLPSYREGLPKALLEACASGRPIVATDVPGCREVVRTGENGILVGARDSDALAGALRTLLVDRGLRECMGARGREIAVEEFSLERVIQATLKVYSDLLEGGRGE